MSVNVPLLIFGLLLLWFPRQWMRFGRIGSGRRRRSSRGKEPWTQREPGDSRLMWNEFGILRNYFDLLRALAGGFAVIGWHTLGGAFVIGENASSGAARQVLAAKVGIAVIGLLLQTVRYDRQHFVFFAPVFYVAGLSVALCGPWAALFAFLLIWAINPMFGSAEAFLTVYGVVMVAFAVFFKDTPRLLAVAAFVIAFLPVLVALLARRPLVVFVRNSGGSG